jgi:signal peptidase I
VTNPITRLTRRLPRPARIAVDWFVTIAAAVAIVLFVKVEVATPYRIPSASMEPTFHCGGGPGCHGSFSDRVLANRFIYRFRDPRRGERVVFHAPARAAVDCSGGGVFVKRLIGLPGDLVSERDGFVYVNGQRLDEPYVKASERDAMTKTWPRIPSDHYFFMGDNRVNSCDSRVWGPVPRSALIGPVFAIYWPPHRLSFR